METTLGGYVRGQLIVCVSLGIFVFIALTKLDVRSALVLAAFAAVVEIIPLVGPLIGAVPAILVALLDSPEKAILVAVAFAVIQQLEAQFLVPKVMERQVGLGPLLVLLALAAGNLLAGLFGAIIAIPIAAAVNVIVRRTLIEPTVEARKLPVIDGGVLLARSGDPPPRRQTGRKWYGFRCRPGYHPQEPIVQLSSFRPGPPTRRTGSAMPNPFVALCPRR